MCAEPRAPSVSADSVPRAAAVGDSGLPASGPDTAGVPDSTGRLGRVTIEPAAPVVAGSRGEWRVTLTVGAYGIDEGGTIKLAHRFASDWENPQFTEPAQPGFTTVRTPGAARLRPRFDPKGHIRPWMKAIVIDVYDGSLEPGDTVVITLGDRSQGSPGIRAQTFIESAHVFQVFVDPTNACLARPVPSPTVPVVAGPAERLVCQVPAQAVVGRAFVPLVKGEDSWMNPTAPPAEVSVRWVGGGRVALAGGTVVPEAAGDGYLEVTSAGLRARSNWITLHATPPPLSRYWGDLHAQTDSTVGTGTEEEYFTFGRDRAGLDFIGHQGNDFQLTDEDWRRLNDVGRRFNEPGRFVVLPGYEWSANTPSGGDRNVIYDREDQPIFRSSHWQVPDVAENALSPAHPADVLFRRLKENGHAFTCAHVGGRYADIRRYFDPEICPLVEVASCWGIFEWLLWDAFDCGYRVGIMANSDGHKGRPGAEGPGAGEFGIAGGLTCVLAPELTRQAIFDALRERRCYGTTGPRIDLDFTVNGHPMGAVVRDNGGGWTARFAVRSNAALDTVDLFQGRSVLQTFRPAAFDGRPSARVRVSWSGARIRGRGRRVRWDGVIRTDQARILSATGFAFDSPADGIVRVEDQAVHFRSQTTGDTDGIELVLERPEAGNVVLETAEGAWEVPLAGLPGAGADQGFELGEVDRRVRFERYPDALDGEHLAGEVPLYPPAGAVTPYFVKVTRSDGHMAWASPIYIDRRTPTG
jgi:hypothetical protein